MKQKKRSIALLLAVLMLLSVLPVTVFANVKTGTVYGEQDFEAFTAGQTLKATDGFAKIISYYKVLEEEENTFLRLPIACSVAGAPKTAPTNRGSWFIINHDAFSPQQKTSIKVDLRPHAVSGSNTPNIGLWLSSVSYTDTTGASKSESYFRFFDVNLATGDFTFNKVTGTKTGAKGLTVGAWNTVEVIFDPSNGSFDIYVNNELYAECQAPVSGSNFSVGANKLMYCVCNSNSNANYAAAASLDGTYSNCNYMDADNFLLSTCTEERVKPRWTQDFEDATSLDDVLVEGKSRPVGAFLSASATDASDRVLQFNIEATAPQPYYLVNTSAKNSGVLTGYTLSADGKTLSGGSATVNKVAYQGVQGTINTASCATVAKDAEGNDIANLYICTGALADAQVGFLGNVAIPLYLKNNAMSYHASEDYVFDMNVYLSPDAKGTIAAQITVKRVSDNATRAVQPFVFKADGNKATVQMNTNQTMLSGANKVVTLGTWNRVTVLIHKNTGAASVFVNGEYAFTAENKTNSNAFYTTIREPVSVVENSFFFQYNRWTTPASLKGFLQVDDLAMYNKTGGLNLEYYTEDFEGYAVGSKVQLGSSVIATATYAQDPENAENTVVKAPLTAKEDKTEILLRLSGNIPVEHKPTHATAPQIGYFTVTRNASTHAVEVSGYTVTEESGGTYTVTDGSNTYTGLKLTTKDEYTGYWGGDGVVDQNWQLPSPKILYSAQRTVTFSVDYYLSEDANAPFIGQYKSYAQSGSSKPWMDLYTVYPGTEQFQPYGGSKHAGMTRGEWHTVTMIFDLASGTMSYFLDGVFLETLNKHGTNLDLSASVLMVVKPLRKQSSYRDFKGYTLVDNVSLLPTQSEQVVLNPENLMYVELNGSKLYTNTFVVPAGTHYNAVYFNEDDYAGLLSTEQKNSIRLSEAAGLRFATKIDLALVEQLYALLDAGDLADVTFGTLIAPADYVNGEFTMDALKGAGKKFLTVEATRDKYFSFDEDESTTHFVGSIVDILEQNISRDFSGRGYVTVTFKMGGSVTLYSTVMHSNDVQSVAQRVLELGGNWNADQKKILDTFAEGKQPPLSARRQSIQKLAGLNVLAIGDSVFQGHTLNTGNQWLALLAEECGWNMTNLGRNGWTVAYNPGAYAEGQTVRNSMYKYLMENSAYTYGSTSYYNYGDTAGKTAADVDVIFLEGGWNDYGWNIPLGTVDSETCDTLMGARNLMIDQLLKLYPNATIVLVTTWHNSDQKTLNGETVKRIDYVSNSIKEAAATRYANNDRVVVLDMGDPTVSGAYMADAAWRAVYALDSVHLNEKGMQVVAENLPEEIAALLFPDEE